jgi:DNA-binding HxlR family transcriptional regulator
MLHLLSASKVRKVIAKGKHFQYVCDVKKRSPTICPIVFSLDIFGDKWSLVILRDILLRNKNHFREFLASDEKIASNVLSDRLESLVREGLLTRESDETNKSAAIYKPTKKALELLPMIFELMRWGIVYNPNVDTSGPVMRRFMSDPEGLQKWILEKFRHRTRRG